MLVDDESAEQGIREASQLMEHLGIQPEQLVEGAYLDLIQAGERAPVPVLTPAPDMGSDPVS